MEIGTVFKWINYPEQRDGITKDRWFVYLGTSSKLSTPLNVFIFTTTSKTNLYKSGNERENKKNTINFKAGEFGFDVDCILDVFFFQNNWTLGEFEKYKKYFDIKGKISNEKLKIIYGKILKENSIQKIIKIDIKTNLNNIRIFGLERPKQ
ncbi:MAG: hypothetical protein COZ07_01755 [Candidatus Infernicultor aquiphilus]|uniref:Uncharacterized protein n=1 Tax=Candidatus Infernicultor aquiphilus TaxID=1805029 RepID=A0A1J5H7F7_9BACT|nr:hypothetical protein [bacterium]OIP75072.1 MAG: hypothetical protein AUK42_00155 [Candidatus Atribacteria bacterium CG2_30_33_13]PIU24868.1 MAG: hypothetical protein COT11_05770 [Candidatus Atribacteria bacterium CG08_land_8_20_14_0_20_33_29]PIW12186.1 MAG: hypothetical protein COW35_02765 [Candidatus Atribacteria bacterium CG17_big_fil_post_rev_8_21_14_2_50_34_11]PIX33817.1 MAG: hypothetical protein COZ58_06285 [Candidatus Atribacteria bacterium CG_4_8_14_3_um_filter_34_18]PIY33536.1 MAG: 